MRFKLVLAILAIFIITPYAWAEPWWENAQIQQTLTEKSIDQEVCGSGIDEDGVGGDAPCPGGDSDLDGYPDDQDCEPLNKFVYPGISTTCDINGGSANGWKTCQSDGTFTPCVDSAVQPLCEAQGDGLCYYFDPVNGDNGNDGSYQHPWKDYVKLLNDNPNRHSPGPGDVFYFMSGLYSGSYDSRPRNFDLSYIGKLNDFPIVFKNYPGKRPIFSNYANEGDEKVAAIIVNSSKNIIVEGFEIVQNPDPTVPKTDTGLYLVVSYDVVVRNMYIHDVFNDWNGSVSGCVYFNVVGGSHGSELRNSIIHDCYKINDGGNVGNVYVNALTTGKTRVMYNTVFTNSTVISSIFQKVSAWSFINDHSM